MIWNLWQCAEHAWAVEGMSMETAEVLQVVFRGAGAEAQARQFLAWKEST